jgi:uncharacterized protein YndB with AHSA1/START domain
MSKTFSINTLINATPTKVWQTLTNHATMAQWLGEPDMEIEVDTDWQVGSPFKITGFHHVRFENKGRVTSFETERKAGFTHLSSISGLPDKPESYSTITFSLEPVSDDTRLQLDIENFPTMSIRKHLEFYWRATLGFIKDKAEKESANN